MAAISFIARLNQLHYHLLIYYFLYSFDRRICGIDSLSTHISSRRDMIAKAVTISTGSVFYINTNHQSNIAKASTISTSTSMVTTIHLESPKSSLGVQVYDTKIGDTRNVVAIQRIVNPNPRNLKLEEGMIVKGYSSSKELVQRLQSGPYPIDLEFINLAAGGDASGDLGKSIVTPKDALDLAKELDKNNVSSDQRPRFSYSIKTVQDSMPSKCSITTRRGDVLAINYDASYISSDGIKVPYDSSSFRGTGQPYQMVLGSGDMIPGVDQGLYDMCPGQIRVLNIPPPLGYTTLRTMKMFRIPSDYIGLEWRIELVSIDATITKDNNDITRDERESRFPY